MSNEQSRKKAWEQALANTKLEYPNWQPDEEFMEMIEKNIKGELTTDEAIQVLVEKYQIS